MFRGTNSGRVHDGVDHRELKGLPRVPDESSHRRAGRFVRAQTAASVMCGLDRAAVHLVRRDVQHLGVGGRDSAQWPRRGNLFGTESFSIQTYTYKLHI